jgi:alanine racemase
MDEMIAHGIVLPIVSFESAQQISAIACAQQTTATVHIKLDTGMGRAGIHWTEAVQVLAQIATLPGLQVEGIFTHFPLAYEQGSDFTDIQVKRFSDILEAAQGLGYHFKYIHAANSDAINNAQITCQTPFNLVRCGINLHGAFDAAGSLRVPLQPVLKMTTRLAQVRTLPADTPIGYGHTFRTQAPMRVGTVCAGYADGLPLALSNKGTVIIRGVEVPIIGRISMDYLTVCLDNVPDAQTGDCITLLGRDGEAEIQVDTWAKLKQTHAYDIICSIGSRVERRCV